MHFLDFPKEARQHTRQQWYSAVDGVLEQLREARQVESQIQHRAPHNRHPNNLQQAHSLVGVSA